MTRFFIALLPPQAIQVDATLVIQELRDRYHIYPAKAPPHITLQAPFEWQAAEIRVVEDCLGPFAAQREPVSIQLAGFNAFAPRVLYIHVTRSAPLLQLQVDLGQMLASRLGIVDPQARRRAFTPHLTVASRNMTPAVFKQAWADLQTQPFAAEFVGDRLTLLIHTGQHWEIHAEFPLSSVGDSRN